MLEKVLKYVFDVFMIYLILWMVFSLCEVFVPMWVITFFSLIVAGIINEDLDGDSNDETPNTGGDIQNNLSL
jgi:hypothetical protein